MTTPRLTAPQARVIRAMQAGATYKYRRVMWEVNGATETPSDVRQATLHALIQKGLVSQQHHWPEWAVSGWYTYSLTEAGKAWKDDE